MSVIGVGDKKTPKEWNLDGCSFIPETEQVSELARSLPWNHYSRKMLGYVRAIESGASAIIDTDDDNSPKDDWSCPSLVGRYEVVHGEDWINVYRHFLDDNIWPRGFPLSGIKKSVLSAPASRRTDRTVNVGVWQGLADGDPDVDAIYRMVLSKGDVVFGVRDPVVLELGCMCPFNSQNTLVRRELFPLLYLPATVTFRFTDILRGLVAQPIMWAAGYHLGFTKATVVQERNHHVLTDDFEDEIPVYTQVERVRKIACLTVVPRNSVADNLRLVYTALTAEGIVRPEEMTMLGAWLSALDWH